jgi:hypothetical protein
VVAALVGGYGVLRLALPAADEANGPAPARADGGTPSAADGETPSQMTGEARTRAEGKARSTADREGHPTAAPEARPTADAGSPRQRHWRRVLARLDRARERAWREGRPELLRSVWSSTSTGLTADRAMLRAWTRRDLAVAGVSLVFERVTAVDRTRRRVVLHTVDHLGPLAAVRRTGPSDSAGAVATERASRELPQDRPTRHRLTLVRTPDGWRISEATPLA